MGNIDMSIMEQVYHVELIVFILKNVQTLQNLLLHNYFLSQLLNYC